MLAIFQLRIFCLAVSHTLPKIDSVELYLSLCKTVKLSIPFLKKKRNWKHLRIKCSERYLDVRQMDCHWCHENYIG